MDIIRVKFNKVKGAPVNLSSFEFFVSERDAMLAASKAAVALKQQLELLSVVFNGEDLTKYYAPPSIERIDVIE